MNEIKTDPFLIARILSTTISQAIIHAENKFGAMAPDSCRAMTILMEEVGEAAEEVLDYTRPGTDKGAHRDNAIYELAQVAAVAIRMIAMLEREGEE